MINLIQWTIGILSGWSQKFYMRKLRRSCFHSVLKHNRRAQRSLKQQIGWRGARKPQPKSQHKHGSAGTAGLQPARVLLRWGPGMRHMGLSQRILLIGNVFRCWDEETPLALLSMVSLPYVKADEIVDKEEWFLGLSLSFLLWFWEKRILFSPFCL